MNSLCLLYTSILYGILITWVLGLLCELTGIYIPNPDAGTYSVIPTSFISFDFSALGKTCLLYTSRCV